MSDGEFDFDGKVDCDGECDSEDDEKDDNENNDGNMMDSQRTPPAPDLPGRRTRGKRKSDEEGMGEKRKASAPRPPRYTRGVGREAGGMEDRGDADEAMRTLVM